MKKVVMGSLFVLAGANVFASADSPEESVQQFYAAAVGGHCERAAELRPGFTKARCEKLGKADIQSVASLANDGVNAVVKADIELVSGGAAQHFNGYIHLQKRQEDWVLMDFSEAASTREADYIARRVKTAVTGQTPLTNPVTDAPDVIGDDPVATLAMLAKRFPDYANGKIALVDVSRQRMMLYENGRKLAEFPVSTAVKGVGSQAGSDQTPLGAHRISEKFGDDAQRGSIFTARNDTGQTADILTTPEDVPTDYVTTRILWLDGLEPGKNQGGDVDSHSRFIYIHGTPEEGLIGKPASHGCIRMKNDDVMRVYDLLDKNTLVYIGE
jgi:lipoprotein-anchoring transpeptidase ErfK/SrfK